MLIFTCCLWGRGWELKCPRTSSGKLSRPENGPWATSAQLSPPLPYPSSFLWSPFVSSSLLVLTPSTSFPFHLHLLPSPTHPRNHFYSFLDSNLYSSAFCCQICQKHHLYIKIPACQGGLMERGPNCLKPRVLVSTLTVSLTLWPHVYVFPLMASVSLCINWGVCVRVVVVELADPSGPFCSDIYCLRHWVVKNL